MKYAVYIRPLVLCDSEVSYQWRNNPEVWKYTGARPDKVITPEIEREWLAACLARDDEYRFAICLKTTGQYIGNVQLIQVKNKNAQFHIFIGDQQYWGKGIGKQATALTLQHAFENLMLDSVTLSVNKENHAAIEIYRKMHFQQMGEGEIFFEMVLTRKMYKKVLSHIYSRI
ncbi:GNAT family N-acetyltransferase [Desertivirga xinjiangensis]|uniref:GNAT family N-acetyltransferase n=1 Tax=Desertivirga xinjiangensis TaxID=539206 RepID=UPI0021094DEE|nr:GNAT family N-acetyltransferase [Pedobacter xinjiangensis]